MLDTVRQRSTSRIGLGLAIGLLLSSMGNDNLSTMQPLILKSFLAMKQSSNLKKGVNGKTDMADFVWLAGCDLGQTERDDMHTLLSKRFDLDWLEAKGFCN